MGTRLSSKFTKVKHKTIKKQHIVYYVKCRPENRCSEDFTRETVRKLSERVFDYNDNDAKSHLVKACHQKNPYMP